MCTTRPRLVIVRGDRGIAPALRDRLAAHFEITLVEDAAEAAAVVARVPEARVLGAAGVPPVDANEILLHLDEAVGIVDRAGRIVWANERLRALDEPTRAQFAQRCRPTLGSPERASGRRTLAFQCGGHAYELLVAPTAAGVDGAGAALAIGLLSDVTTRRRLQDRLGAIDAAGSELVKIEASSIADLNMAQRLKLLEEKIVRYVHDLLNFDNFEIRLLDRRTNQLELVIAVGLTPLKIGEVIFAEPEGNGISGFVAATGRSYVCADVRRDPLYRDGLDNAASSLTVPLRLHDRIIGVFNVESYTPDSFDENDRRFAEIFGRYIAVAMNILDLLVSERYTTNERLGESVLGEISQPLGEIAATARRLREAATDEATRRGLAEVLDAAETVRRRIETCTAGPRSIIGAEQELRRHEVDPAMAGKRVLVADDDETIRTTVAAILTQKGCHVSAFDNGLAAIDAIERARCEGAAVDLVISDIRLPERNGYEVFRASKAAFPDTPLILMTGFGYDPHHSIARATDEGLQACLFKPFRATDLLESIGRVLGGVA